MLGSMSSGSITGMLAQRAASSYMGAARATLGASIPSISRVSTRVLSAWIAFGFSALIDFSVNDFIAFGFIGFIVFSFFEKIIGWFQL